MSCPSSAGVFRPPIVKLSSVIRLGVLIGRVLLNTFVDFTSRALVRE
jgi:hypothetical protein